MDQNFNTAPLKYSGMTVTERLWENNLSDEYFSLLKRKDNIPRIVEILKKIELGRVDIVSILKNAGLYSQFIDYQFCMSDGQKADINHRYSEAIGYYEQECQDQLKAWESIPNLAFLYWSILTCRPLMDQSADLNYNPSFLKNKINTLLDYGSKLFKYNCEPTFWRLYYLTYDGFSLSESEWLMIINRFTNLYPPSPRLFFVCYPFNKTKFRPQIDSALEEANNCPTALNMFVKQQIARNEEN